VGRLGRVVEPEPLVLFHNETWGGEKVFQLMSKLAENVPPTATCSS
jgi:type VI protein secretion system component VasF